LGINVQAFRRKKPLMNHYVNLAGGVCGRVGEGGGGSFGEEEWKRKRVGDQSPSINPNLGDIHTDVVCSQTEERKEEKAIIHPVLGSGVQTLLTGWA